MKKEQKYSSAGKILKKLRSHTVNPSTGKALTQKEVEELLVKYDAYPLDKPPSLGNIYNWETGRSRPQHRRILIVLLKILCDFGGLTSHEDANRLTREFGYGGLDKQEIDYIFNLQEKVEPYPGLKPFDEKQAPFFFGRDAKINMLVEKLEKGNFFAVIGPSGCGKSSLIAAGLIPRLRKSSIILRLRPANKPYQQLAKAIFTRDLWPEKSDVQLAREENDFIQSLQSGQIILPQILRYLLEANNHKSSVLLIIDQFEELFTLSDNDVQDGFVNQLVSIVQDQEQQEKSYKLLLSMRSDFYETAVETDLQNLLEGRNTYLGKMAKADIKEAIIGPAKKANIDIEPEVVERIVEEMADMEETSNNLPLLQFCLRTLYETAFEGKITLSAYSKLGGLKGSIDKYANERFRELTMIEQQQAKKLFLCLVKQEWDMKPIGRRATRVEIESLGIDWETAQKLGGIGLVSFVYLEDETKAIELIHESLLHHWSKLQHEWLVEIAEFRLWRGRLQRKMIEWENSDDESALLRGKLLEEAERWMAQRNLPKETERYIEKSRKHENYLREKHQNERESERQRAILFSTLGSLGGGLGFLITFFIFFYQQRLEESQIGILILESILRLMAGSVAGFYFVTLVNTAASKFRDKKSWVLAGLAGSIPIVILFQLHGIFLNGIPTNEEQTLPFWNLLLFGIVFGTSLGLSTKVMLTKLWSKQILFPLLCFINAIIFLYLELRLGFPISDTFLITREILAIAGFILSIFFLFAFQLSQLSNLKEF